MTFDKWLDTFVQEKGINTEEVLEVEGSSGTNFIPVEALIALIKSAPKNEQSSIKSTIVKIDFRNGDVLDFFKHLAKAVAQ